jgi:hypothetical protein
MCLGKRHFTLPVKPDNMMLLSYYLRVVRFQISEVFHVGPRFWSRHYLVMLKWSDYLLPRNA